MSMSDDRGLVISLCDRSTVSCKPWASAGFECWAVDLMHDEGVGLSCDNIVKIGTDVNHWSLPEGRKIAFMMAWPPCTHLAVSGARWFKGKGLHALADSIRVVASVVQLCLEAKCPYMIENPVGTLSTYWRKPDYTFDPCDYAKYADDPDEEAYTKKTCLWVGGGFVMPDPNGVDAIHGSKMHLLSRSADRADIRSITPSGFANAVFVANRDSQLSFNK